MASSNSSLASAVTCHYIKIFAVRLFVTDGGVALRICRSCAEIITCMCAFHKDSTVGMFAFKNYAEYFISPQYHHLPMMYQSNPCIELMVVCSMWMLDSMEWCVLISSCTCSLFTALLDGLALLPHARGGLE